MVLTTELPLVAKDELASQTQGHESELTLEVEEEEPGLLHSVGLQSQTRLNN